MIPPELVAELRKHEATLDAFCWLSSRLLFAGGVIFCALLALVRNEGNPVAATRDSIARDMTIGIGLVDEYGAKVEQLTGLDVDRFRALLVRIRAWASGASTTTTIGGYVAIDRNVDVVRGTTGTISDGFVKAGSPVLVRRGAFRVAIDRAANLVAVPARDIIAPQPGQHLDTDGVVPTVQDYASALSSAAQETGDAGVADLQRLLRIQCECEIGALMKLSDWLRSQISPSALADKATAGPRAYLADVQKNKTPAPWGVDVVQDILNDPTKTYSTIDAGERIPVGDGEKTDGGGGLGIAAAVLVGLAVLR